MATTVTLEDKHIKLIFAKAEGRLLYEEESMIYFSERSMLGSLFSQSPEKLKEEIQEAYPKVTTVLHLGRNI